MILPNSLKPRRQKLITDSMKRLATIIFALCIAFSAYAAEDAADTAVFSRGIGKMTSTFIPKGTVGGGLSMSYSSYQLGNAAKDAGFQMLFSLLDNMHGNLQSFGIAPYVSYFIKDNLSLGLRFDYDKSGFNMDSMDLALGDLMTLNLSDMNYLKQSYSGSLTLRNYMPIATSKRFAMFAELRATGAYAQSQSYKMQDGKKYGTYQDIYKGSLSVVPGLCCFVTEEAAVEVSVGVLGFTHQKTVQTTNQVEVSQMTQSNASFKIDLFSINLGLSIYILPGKNKTR